MTNEIINYSNINKELVSTTELAKMLNTTKNVILNTAKRCDIKKDIKHGISTLWNKEETSIIIKNIDYNNPNSNEELIQNNSKIKTDIIIKEEANISLQNIMNLDKNSKIKASLLLQADILKMLEQENNNLKQDNLKLNQENTDFQTIHKDRQIKSTIRSRINEKVRELAKTYQNYQTVWQGLYKVFDTLHNNVCYRDKKNKLEYLINHNYGNELLEILLTRF